MKSRIMIVFLALSICLISNGNTVYASEQLAKWLEELKKYKSYKPVDKEFYKEGYTKAIDDFAKRILEEDVIDIFSTVQIRYEQLEEYVKELANQLKEGGIDIPNKYSRCKNCEYFHENGNCLKVGGFYSSVDDKDCVKEGSADNE